MRKFFSLLGLLGLCSFTMAQSLTQTVRGTIVDKNTQTLLVGVVVKVATDPAMVAVTDINGEFKFPKVPVGRQSFQFSMVSYQTQTVSNVIVTTGKEVVLTVELEEKIIETQEIVVYARKKDKPINEMATVSARSFTVEETEKYAGSWGDPSRMALNFAGVSTGGDQVNDIIIRGNSPQGLLWRLEGMSIPNPNHFGTLGTTGGPISMLNNNVLSNSDFFTGAFPAEYGNALSGAFDLSMRNGNNEKREYVAQVGMGGVEFGTEGPFSKNSKASYMVNYRYSTLAIPSALGINTGVDAIPKYQDLSFKVNVPTMKMGTFSWFGLAGLSSIYFNEDEGDSITARTNFNSDMAVTGLVHKISFKDNSRIITRVGVSSSIAINDYYKTNNGELVDDFDSHMLEMRYNASTEYRKRITSKDNLAMGVNYEIIALNSKDSVYDEDYKIYYHGQSIDDHMGLLQSFIQVKHSFSEKVSIVPGIHYQYSTLSNEHSIEPRFSFKWNVGEKSTLNLGYGLHSQIQARAVLFTDILTDTLKGTYSSYNRELKFSKSHHLIIGYETKLNENFRFKVEPYAQYLYNIPVEKNPSAISLINYGSSYNSFENFDSLVNTGVGYNYGVDITIERFLTNNFYFLSTLSLFDSKYKAGDDVWRNTYYNGNWVYNILGGYDIKVKKRNTLYFNAKAVWAGGKRVLPIDVERSRESNSTKYDYKHIYEKRAKDYYKIDVKVGYRINKPKYTLEYAVDLTNITGHKNAFMEQWDDQTQQVEQSSQMGFFPMGLIRVTW